MNELELIISLFPLVFMIHEFEEIICLKRWVSKNGLWLTSKYPKLTKQVTHLGQLSVSAFTVAVLEEFVLVSIITVLALTLQWYSVWIAAFTAFTFHVFLHIIQSGIIRKYIPAIIKIHIISHIIPLIINPPGTLFIIFSNFGFCSFIIIHSY